MPYECPQPADCEFEEYDFEFCSWLNVENRTIDKFDWNLHSGLVSVESTYIPATDHTYRNKTGHYMYVSAVNKNPGDNALIYSESMQPTSDSGMCMTFYYSIGGSKCFL